MRGCSRGVHVLGPTAVRIAPLTAIMTGVIVWPLCKCFWLTSLLSRPSFEWVSTLMASSIPPLAAIQSAVSPLPLSVSSAALRRISAETILLWPDWQVAMSGVKPFSSACSSSFGQELSSTSAVAW